MKENTTTGNHNTQVTTMVVVLLILTACVLLRTLLDLAESRIHGFHFYFTESVLFSSFWWIFLPFLCWQLRFTHGRNPIVKGIFLVAIPVVAHLAVYPGVVWLLSKLFYYHTFSYGQTLAYELTDYGFVLLAVYSIPFALFSYFQNKISGDNRYADIGTPPEQRLPLNTLVIVDGTEKRVISVADIISFSANSPYINIHHREKRYLQTETLKSISKRLDDEIFVRVHKAVIVNIQHVRAYKSRLNGDYDLTMSDGRILRLSRNYTSSFKQKFERAHQDTAK